MSKVLSFQHTRPNTALPTLTIVCLCAAWCDSCRAYRPIFEKLANEYTALRFVWCDTDNDIDIIVDDYPTLVAINTHGCLFWGDLLPHEGVIRRLLTTWQHPHTALTTLSTEQTEAFETLYAQLFSTTCI